MSKHTAPESRVIEAVAVLLLMSAAMAYAQTPQQHVHQMSQGVMPFDALLQDDRIRGEQRVTAKDPVAADQIALTQQHLQHEANRFQQGDYSDPTMLRGANMPGLRELQAGASRMKVSYAALPAGAEIIFETADLTLLTAPHR